MQCYSVEYLVLPLVFVLLLWLACLIARDRIFFTHGYPVPSACQPSHKDNVQPHDGLLRFFITLPAKPSCFRHF